MSYIGHSVENRISPAFLKEDFVGDGSTTVFTLTNEVPGGASHNVMVVINNVVQEPDVAYTIAKDSNDKPTKLTFTGTPETGDSIYVIHRGISGILTKPPTNSVGVNELDVNLRSFTTDTFTTVDNSTTQFTLSEAPVTANSVMVFVDGILQKLTTNYTITGTTLDFGNGNAPATGSEIEVKHLGLRTTARRSVTMQLDTHTFNGSVNNFTLSNDVDTNDAFVFYNGVCMTPTTDYAISGKVITFTFTPVANSQVMVRYGV
jgi:hypothetical protein